MSKSIIYKDVMRGYERDRNDAARLLKERMEALYEKVPRVREIDAELSGMGTNLSSMILRNDSDRLKLLGEMREMCDALHVERDRLLKKSGIKADYFETFKCADCKDTGYAGDDRCRCLNRRLIDKYYEMSNIGKVLKRENFGAFEADYYSGEVDAKTGMSPRAVMETNYKKCREFVEKSEDADAPPDSMNMYLYGNTGLGKTFLCNCVAKEFLDKGHTVLYLTAPQLFKMVEDARFKRDGAEENDERVEMVYSVELLIIDDLGSEFQTTVTVAEFFNIINSRLIGGKRTIISSNLNPAEFNAVYSDRITSRVYGNYAMLLFVGNDIRLFKKYNAIK
jgi:DNA replication protein DnaC